MVEISCLGGPVGGEEAQVRQGLTQIPERVQKALGRTLTPKPGTSPGRAAAQAIGDKM